MICIISFKLKGKEVFMFDVSIYFENVIDKSGIYLTVKLVWKLLNKWF